MRDPDADTSVPEASPATVGTPGALLKAARAARGLGLEEIALELRIEVSRLEMLEADRFADIGPPVFAKGYLKLYGGRLGLRPADLLVGYEKLVAPEVPAIARSPAIRLRDERQITLWIVAALIIALLVGALAVWWRGVPARAPAAVPDAPAAGAVNGDRGGAVTARLPTQARVQTPVSAVTPRATDDNAVPPPRGDEPAAARPAENSAEPGAAPGAADGLAAAAGFGATDPGAANGQEPAQPVPPLRSPVELRLEFLDDSWTEVTDARGVRLFYGIGRAGTGPSMVGEAPVSVFLGNAPAVRVAVDGHPFDVPARPGQGNLARFSIDAPD